MKFLPPAPERKMLPPSPIFMAESLQCDGYDIFIWRVGRTGEAGTIYQGFVRFRLSGFLLSEHENFNHVFRTLKELAAMNVTRADLDFDNDPWKDAGLI